MEKLVMLVSRVPRTKPKNDEDVFDRLSNRYTVLMLVVFAVALSLNQYVGKPITCWAPKEFTGSHMKFMNSYCWVKNTYYLPFENQVPKSHEWEKRHELQYYQWIQFILLFQALLFYLPSVIWNGLNQGSGVDCDNILAAASTFQKSEKTDKRKRTLGLITNQMDRFLSTCGNSPAHHPDDSAHERESGPMKILALSARTIGCKRRSGSYLISLFIVSKVFYLLNAITQLFLLNRILKVNYNVYGAEVIDSLIEGRDLITNSTFPRVTMCDFRVRALGNIRRYTVQCVLPINLYMEKIYAFLWFWIVFVAIATAVGAFVWIMRIGSRQDRFNFVRNHLVGVKKMDHDLEKKLINDFVENYLKQDGAFILRLIGHNTNTLTVNEIIRSLWDHWGTKINRNTLNDNDPYAETKEKLPID